MSTYEDWEAEADHAAYMRAKNREEWEQNQMADRMWSDVKVDGQLLHVQIGRKAGYLGDNEVGSEIALILPFIRGVSKIRESHGSYEKRIGFTVLMDKGEPITIQSSVLQHYGTIDSDVKPRALQVMTLVRHKVLEAINEYNTRQFIGEQFKLPL